jgi:ABC-type antimicrobial peptide transport system permease subunit
LRERSGSPQRLSLTLLGIFALVALGLAAVGLYGVLSYLVAQRQREIGVRMALGAQQRDVIGMVVREGLLLLAAGAVVGILAGLALARVLDHLLYGIGAADPLTFGAVLGVLGAVTMVACWLPARRAAKVDPMVALRAE